MCFSLSLQMSHKQKKNVSIIWPPTKHLVKKKKKTPFKGNKPKSVRNKLVTLFKKPFKLLKNDPDPSLEIFIRIQVLFG